MQYPVITVRERELGYRFMAAEAAWILSGDDKVATIEPFSKRIASFSDDGERFFGAYGPKVLGQLAYAAATLKEDVFSRRSVISIWRENPPTTKDYPCTLSLQFLVRPPFVHTVATMRSSDAWLGWPYDVFNFTMITVALLQVLREIGGPGYQLGSLTLTAGSQHLYEENFEAAKVAGMKPTELFQYRGLDPWEFKSPEHVISHLWSVARGEAVSATWLNELPHMAEVVKPRLVH